MVAHVTESIFLSHKLSREKANHLSHVIVEFLSLDDDVEFHDDQNAIRLAILKTIHDELKRDLVLDQEVKRKIEGHRRPIVEGSREWDILYKKYFEEAVSRTRRFTG